MRIPPRACMGSTTTAPMSCAAAAASSAASNRGLPCPSVSASGKSTKHPNSRSWSRNGSRKWDRSVAFRAPYPTPWYPPRKAMTPGFPVAKRAVLNAASTASKPEHPKITLPVSTTAVALPRRVHRSKVRRLNSRARRAFNAWGCTSPMAWSNSPICRWPARTTAELACPAAATPKAAVRSR